MNALAIGPNLSHLSSIDLDDVLLAYLARAPKPLTAPQITRFLSALAAEADVRRSIQDAKRDRTVLVSGSRLILSDAGKERANAFLGSDRKATWARIRDWRLPVIVLGLDPDKAEVRKMLANHKNFIGAICGVTWGLPAKSQLSVKSVRTEIVWQVVRDRMGDIVGRGPFPVLEKPGPVATVILASLADTKRGNIDNVTSALAAKSLGASSAKIDALRARLIELGLRTSTSTNGSLLGTSGEQVDLPFAERVLALVRENTTSPFGGRVAIAEVFDAYSDRYGNGTTLEEFKKALVNAASARQLQLDPIPLPDLMNADLLERSATRWNRENVHLVSTEI